MRRKIRRPGVHAPRDVTAMSLSPVRKPERLPPGHQAATVPDESLRAGGDRERIAPANASRQRRVVCSPTSSTRAIVRSALRSSEAIFGLELDWSVALQLANTDDQRGGQKSA
jgi:hypothetical protein